MIPPKPPRLEKILSPRTLTPCHLVTPQIKEADVIIGIALHNQRAHIRRALQSALEQQVDGKLGVVILDDGSSDDWQKDDRLAHHNSLSALVREGYINNARFVVGSNSLVLKGSPLPEVNYATAEVLLNSDRLQQFIEAMSQGETTHELPSCNLLLKTHTGFRYPNIKSAEDHWLLAQLLFMHSQHAAVVRTPIYCEYTLNGHSTAQNRETSRWQRSRSRLAETTNTWLQLLHSGSQILGYGMEGVVERIGGTVRKTFCMRTISDENVSTLQHLLKGTMPHIPEPNWYKNDAHQWVCEYRWFPSQPVEPPLDVTILKHFLLHCLQREVAPRNIKRTNFRLTDTGELCYIDIGSDICPLTASSFLDIAARCYSQFILNWDDEELVRRSSLDRQEDVLEKIPGFASFYDSLIRDRLSETLKKINTSADNPLTTSNNVSLMIKTCAMDAEVLERQCHHIVYQLSFPQRFHEVVLLIDPHPGPFLREHTSADPEKLLAVAEKLKLDGVVDRIHVAPTDEETIRRSYQAWFNINSCSTHTVANAPLFPQLWGFEQVSTQYVLQCDTDVLIGRRDWGHDYLADMVTALEQTFEALGVGFNIPHPLESTPNPYYAVPGHYVPEVRCGLLDLARMHSCYPIENSVVDGKPELTWHRAFEKHQIKHGLKTLRGGDPRTFYIHPLNSDKSDLGLQSRIRDLVAQGIVPKRQLGKWDLQLNGGDDWKYPSRSEEIIVLMKGRNTPEEKLRRCLDSLRAQNDQSFGLVVIDDGSATAISSEIPLLLSSLADRTTLIRRTVAKGRMPNFIEAISCICSNPESLIVVLDQDDALIGDTVISQLKHYLHQGHDLIQAGMHRPDKPLKIYRPEYSAPRELWGAETWAHLRAFKKKLFDAIPHEYLQIEGDWIPECTDWATMLPMVELAQAPLFVEKYFYWHERSEAYAPTKRARLDAIIRQILAKPSLKAVT